MWIERERESRKKERRLSRNPNSQYRFLYLTCRWGRADDLSIFACYEVAFLITDRLTK